MQLRQREMNTPMWYNLCKSVTFVILRLETPYFLKFELLRNILYSMYFVLQSTSTIVSLWLLIWQKKQDNILPFWCSLQHSRRVIYPSSEA